jgi:hypothetical protein
MDDEVEINLKEGELFVWRGRGYFVIPDTACDPYNGSAFYKAALDAWLDGFLESHDLERTSISIVEWKRGFDYNHLASIKPLIYRGGPWAAWIRRESA